MAKNRYVGEYPAIGIRAIIDGRRGPMQLRESLEGQVMEMALAAKKLFEENLHYSNGEPVRVVVADSSIGRVPEAVACAEKFRKEGVAITLSVSPHTHTPQGRLVYSPLNASFSMSSVIITASRNSASLSASPTAWFTAPATSLLPNFVLVCPSNCGSATFTEITAVSPSRKS